MGLELGLWYVIEYKYGIGWAKLLCVQSLRQSAKIYSDALEVVNAAIKGGI